MHFLSIDVETANPYMGSICQIGIARFIDGKIVEEWSTLVDPESYFDEFNSSIHGISQDMVVGKPKLPEVADKIRLLLESGLAVSHTHFDRTAMAQAFDGYGLKPISTTWLDSARVARRTWDDVSRSGFGLSNLCSKIGYDFKHHDALEDAKAAGKVLLAAIRESQIDLDSWLKRVNQPIHPERASDGAAIRRAGNPEGDLFGQVIVFTGTLELPRVDAADLAASVGCDVGQSVTKKTTILVIGDQDVSKLAGHEKSAKQRKAEQLVAEGHPIHIIYEADFKALVRSNQCLNE
jgi:DNA polymerase-3 subunit epsilon